MNLRVSKKWVLGAMPGAFFVGLAIGHAGPAPKPQPTAPTGCVAKCNFTDKATGGCLDWILVQQADQTKFCKSTITSAATNAEVQGEKAKALGTLTPLQMINQGQDYRARILEVQDKATKLRDAAAKTKDVVKLNCVNDKLLQIRGHISLADQAIRALNEASSRSDLGTAQHEFTRLTIIYQKALVLQTEAENCVGEDASYVGATRVTVDVDPNLDGKDPTEVPIPLPEVNVPPPASPWV